MSYLVITNKYKGFEDIIGFKYSNERLQTFQRKEDAYAEAQEVDGKVVEVIFKECKVTPPYLLGIHLGLVGGDLDRLLSYDGFVEAVREHTLFVNRFLNMVHMRGMSKDDIYSTAGLLATMMELYCRAEGIKCT